jgi:3-oxoacyl-[acyl-carrier-protein] synthase II
MRDRDVCVLGLGVVAPAGSNCEQFWDGLMAGRSFASGLSLDVPGLPLIGHVVADGDWLERCSHSERRRLDRVALLGLAAAREALDDAKVIGDTVEPERFAMVAGIGFGGITTLTGQHDVLRTAGWRKLSPFGVAAVMSTSLVAYGSIEFGIKGPAMTVSSACASGTQALVEGARLIADGSADLVLAGGAEAPLDPLPMASFARMEAMSTNVDCPTEASRPFDARRDGFVLGEGAAFLVLGSGRLVTERGLRVLGRIAGWSVTTDGYHITAPDPGGSGAERCLRSCLAMADVEPAAIGHVNAHGTGTRLNDAAEAAAITAVFGPEAVPVTSAKGSIGHLMGGAGAVEAVEVLLSLEHGLVPPTVNCVERDPELSLDVVCRPRTLGPAPAVSCSFGFGGQNACVLITPEDRGEDR